MATLYSGNLEVEIHFHKRWGCRWVDYSFELRFGSIPMFNPLANQEEYRDGKYICCDLWGDNLIPFFEKLVTEKTDGEWEVSIDTNRIKISAETWLSKKDQKMKDWENKTIWVIDFDGELKQEAYSNTMKMLVPYFEKYLKLHIELDSNYFGDPDNYIGGNFSLSLDTSFHALEVFLQELKAEYEIFKVTKFD